MDTMKPDWYSQLKTGPLTASSPSDEQIQHVKHSLTYKHAVKKRHLSWTLLAASLTAIVWFGLSFYQASIKEHIQQAAIPGSRDWNNLTQAIMDYREYSFIKLLYVEPQQDGVLAFYMRSQNGANMNLAVEYMRKTTFSVDWKWVHGGGFGSSPLENRAVYYDYLKSPDPYIHTKTPFPILFGAFDKRLVSNIYVRLDKDLESEAIHFSMLDHTTGWFVYVPDKVREVQIIVKDKNGRIIETHKIDPISNRPGAITFRD